MKVITQLVKHFWQRGALTGAEADYLVDNGFIRPHDLSGYKGRTGKPSRAPASPQIARLDAHDPGDEAWGHLEEQLEVVLLRRRPTRRNKGGSAKRDSLSLNELCRRLNDEFQRRETSLTILIALAAGFGPASDWQNAAASLRRASVGEFSAALSRAFRRGGKLRDAWKALDVEPFHRLLADNELRGRAARAFRALLLAKDPASLGKYAWILKRNEMQAVLNLQSARRRLLMALNEFYHHDWRLLTWALERGGNLVAVWSLVLLHNANRAEHAANARAGRLEYGPVDPPTDETWQQAWTAALEMDHARAMRLLMACYEDDVYRVWRTLEAVDKPLYCPVGWRLPSEAKSGT
jgi:hypothetical protein